MAGFYNGFECTLCGKVYTREEQEKEVFLTCPHCGDKGILDIQYDYESIIENYTKDSLAADEDISIFRYAPLLPIEGKPERPLLRVGHSPLYKSESLRSALDAGPLFIKDDGFNPTGSLKDRASVIAVVKCLEAGRDTICCSSTGNAASSLAGNSARAGLKTLIFVPERVPDGKLAQLLKFGANVVKVEGDYKKAYDMSKMAVDAFPFYNRNAAVNPFLIEGKKTVVLEIMEQLDFQVPDWIVVSVGDGCTIGGVYKGLHDLKSIGWIDRMPKILGVQAEGCRPFVDAFESDGILKEADENTIADSIAVGIPRNPVKGLQAVLRTEGKYIAVDDEAIIEAAGTLGRHEGVFGEPAASAATAGYIKAVKEGIIKKSETSVIIVTGNGLKDVKGALRGLTVPEPVEPTTDNLHTIVERMKENG